MTRDLIALVAFIESKADVPHDFDGNCCVLFTAVGAMRAQFGSAPEIGASWHDERSAKRAIARLGGFEQAVDRLFERIEPHQARMGDIGGLICPDTGFHIALVEGQTLCAPGPDGLTRMPRSAMVAAWRGSGQAKGADIDEGAKR